MTNFDRAAKRAGKRARQDEIDRLLPVAEQARANAKETEDRMGPKCEHGYHRCICPHHDDEDA